MIPHYEEKITRRAMIILAHDSSIMAINKKTITYLQLADLVCLDGFILWNNQGQWGIVSPPALAEWLRNIELFKQQKKQYSRLVLKAPIIDFRSTIPVSDRVAKVLRSQNAPQQLSKTSPSPEPPAGS